MTTKATTNQKALTIPDGYAGFDAERINLIRNNFAKDATFEELKLYLTYAGMRGLDPISRQIIFTKYQTKDGPQIAFITSIDGYRLCADRTGLYAGSDDYTFDGGLSEFEHLVMFDNRAEARPETATATIYKIVAGQRVPFTATARWDEYYPGEKKGFMWRKMPYLMLGKCAEALALRKGFPQELSGMYTDVEMEQVNVNIQQPQFDSKKAMAELGYSQPEIVEPEYVNEDAHPENERPYSTPDTFFTAIGETMNILQKKQLELSTEEINVGFVAGLEFAIKQAIDSIGMKPADDIKYADWIKNWRYVLTERIFGTGKRSSKDLEDYELMTGIRWLRYEKFEDEWSCSEYAVPEVEMLIKLVIDENTPKKRSK